MKNLENELLREGQNLGALYGVKVQCVTLNVKDSGLVGYFAYNGPMAFAGGASLAEAVEKLAAKTTTSAVPASAE